LIKNTYPKNMKGTRKLIRLLVLIFLSSVSIHAFSQKEDIIKKGQPAPSFSFKDEQNHVINSSSFAGKVILINFFATWCPPCRQEMPLLEDAVWKKYKDNQDFKLLAFGRGNNMEEVNKLKFTNQFDFPMFADENKSVYTKFATAVIPRCYIIDKKGVVVYVSSGFEKYEFDKMVSVLNSLLKE